MQLFVACQIFKIPINSRVRAPAIIITTSMFEGVPKDRLRHTIDPHHIRRIKWRDRSESKRRKRSKKGEKRRAKGNWNTSNINPRENSVAHLTLGTGATTTRCHSSSPLSGLAEIQSFHNNWLSQLASRDNYRGITEGTHLALETFVPTGIICIFYTSRVLT